MSAKHGLVGLHKLVSVNRFEDRYIDSNLLTMTITRITRILAEIDLTATKILTPDVTPGFDDIGRGSRCPRCKLEGVARRESRRRRPPQRRTREIVYDCILNPRGRPSRRFKSLEENFSKRSKESG